MSKLLLAILVGGLVGCSNEYTSKTYIEKVCTGNIENFDEHVLQKGISFQLAYLIEDTSAKVKFAEHDINAIIMTGPALIGRLITRQDGDYFAFAPDNGGKIEYKLNSDKWFVGTCK